MNYEEEAKRRKHWSGSVRSKYDTKVHPTLKIGDKIVFIYSNGGFAVNTGAIGTITTVVGYREIRCCFPGTCYTPSHTALLYSHEIHPLAQITNPIEQYLRKVSAG